MPLPQKPYLQNDRLFPRLTLALAMLVVGGIIIFTLYQEHGRIEQRERERLSAQAKMIDENLSRQLDSVYRALKGIRTELPLNGLEMTRLHLRALTDAMPGIRTILITDASGQIIACNWKQVIGQNTRSREYFQAALTTMDPATLHVSPPYRTLLGKFVITTAIMIPGPKGEFTGVVAASLDPEYFNILLGSVLYAPDMWAGLAHGDGKLFLRVPEQKDLAGLDLAKPGSLFTRHRESGRMSTVLIGSAPVTGKERLMAHRTIKPDGIPMDKPLVVGVSRNLSDMYADWRREAIGKGCLFGVLVLATSLALYLYQRRQRKFESISVAYEAIQRDNAERLKLATDAAGVGVWDYDLENGRLTWDDTMFTIFGQNPADFSSRYDAWRCRVLAEDLQGAEAALQTAINGGAPFNTSFRIRRGDGEVRIIRGVGRVHCNETGRPVRIIGINEDITEKQQEADALRKNERFLKTLTNAIPGMVAYWTQDMRCTFANNEYRFWFGKSPDKMLGIHVRELLGEELFSKNEPFILRALSGEEQHFERIMTKSNGVVSNAWVHYIPDVDGDWIHGFYVLVSDVTQLKQAQLQLEELNEVLKQRTEEAEQASSSKSRFLHSVAHEFKTPLSLLTSSTDILDRYGERLSKEQRTEQNGHIRSAARQISSLIDSVLSFNRLETGRPIIIPELLDIGQICRTIAAEVTAVWGNGHVFHVTVPVDCGTALLDEILFRRVLQNLLTNAFRYTPPGGTVSFSVNRECQRLLIDVSDSGIGIPPEDQQRIFDAFYRCPNVGTRRGLGLGLSIVHEALSLMGGTITVDSIISEGTTMRVEIPVVDPLDTEEEMICTQS